MCNEQRFSESGAPIAPTRCAEYIALKQENAALFEQASEDSNVICRLKRIIAQQRAILAPLIAHADRHDYAPPYMLNVQQCREIKGKVNG